MEVVNYLAECVGADHVVTPLFDEAQIAELKQQAAHLVTEQIPQSNVEVQVMFLQRGEPRSEYSAIRHAIVLTKQMIDRLPQN
jgi:hypothetical protein